MKIIRPVTREEFTRLKVRIDALEAWFKSDEDLSFEEAIEEAEKAAEEEQTEKKKKAKAKKKKAKGKSKSKDKKKSSKQVIIETRKKAEEAVSSLRQKASDLLNEITGGILESDSWDETETKVNTSFTENKEEETTKEKDKGKKKGKSKKSKEKGFVKLIVIKGEEEAKSDAGANGNAKKEDTTNAKEAKDTPWDTLESLKEAKTTAEPKAEAKPKSTPKPKSKPTPKPKRKTTASKKAVKVDDLTRIKGVGKVFAQRLNEAGITSLKQVSEFSAEEVAAFDEKLNLTGRMIREDWVSQAKELLKD